MTVLIELKEKLKEFYGSCSGIVLPIVKFLLALAVFRGINSNLGYLKMLNSGALPLHHRWQGYCDAYP